MEFGVMVEPQLGGSYDDLLAIATAAETAGFDSVARSDHYLLGDESFPTTDALATLAGLARETSSLRLTVLVTPLTFRHPGVIAKTAATIAEMSRGRFELGVGTGWMEGEHRALGIDLPDMRTRFSLLFETLAYLHAAFGRSDGGYAGRHFALEDVELLPRPVPSPPIIIGGSGMRRTPTLAGRFADEYNMFACDTETLTARRELMRTTAAELGRDPDAVKVSIVTSAVIGADAAEYRAALEATAAARSRDADELEDMLRSRRVIHGTYEQAASLVAEYASEGVDRIYIQHFVPLPEIDTAGFGSLLGALRDGR
jgi:alkanesulfonate monooxygenase SsuD/methylene tetrahydromethanopterin reductase-like flavin-dependent oxidoreductase (luciferase family)